ncbi:UDP-2,3-diacylglucosamine diphosphatase [Pseudozobellia thermophila]|uniref:UDP-2,3-diacylglucosamine pyrophosphatase LpxH n=1 Tax=Pseudozobellia thermophila TaxID=192903 RepID=A0A1M6N9B9_9FLAO|nr:UDP-2,3-diacylglucosamine diphosphatase [Pseudozobellia thermophila]SHJ92272.1 UDP-2,3-diacylglucosamine pyrophosphatase LpxH [Pseudozobellia thermophila]
MKKRKLEVSVISDVHLGTLESHADELITYLNSIQPKKLILNGDILEVGQLHKKYFPPAHMKVIRKILAMASKGTLVYYVTGNHDDVLRKLSGTSMGNLFVVDKLVLELDGKKAWFFHGDVFDTSLQNTKWLARLGGSGYQLLLKINKTTDFVLRKLNINRYSISEKVKLNGKASKYVKNFEKAGVDMAIDKGYDYVICGHLHLPKKEMHVTKKGSCTYLNSGDWVEHLTALEYSLKRWKIYRYDHDKLSPFFMDQELKEMDMQELVETIAAQKEAKAKKGHKRNKFRK